MMNGTCESVVIGMMSKLATTSMGKIAEMNQVPSAIESFRLQLGDIRSHLSALEKEPEGASKHWTNNARELCYDMEDAIETFQSAQEEARVGVAGRFTQAAGRCSKWLARYGTTRQIERLSIRRSLYEAQVQREGDGSPQQHRPENNFAEERDLEYCKPATNLVGVEGPTNKIIELLDWDTQSSPPRKVVSIVGTGGLGKTTIALNVLRQISSKFDCRAFVSVTHKPKMKKVLAQIVCRFGYNLHTDDQLCQFELPKLVGIVQDFVRTQRYLLVVDDIWDQRNFDDIKCALLLDEGTEGRNCSGGRILVTTCITDCVAAENCPVDVFHVNPLSLDDSRRLFLTSFHRGISTHLEGHLNKILETCDGSPLALTKLSRLLVSMEKKKDWDYVRKSIRAAISNNYREIESMRRILSLGYFNLPDNQRTCLLYLSTFPCDRINKKLVVNRWTAEGLVGDQKGDVIFNELIRKSLLHPVNIMHDGYARDYKVHRTIHDFLVSKSIEQNFVTLLERGHMFGPSDGRKHRRLSVHNTEGVVNEHIKDKDVSHVRSLTVYGKWEQMPRLQHFTVLRVLHMEDEEDSSNRTVDVNSLFHLKYLKHTKQLRGIRNSRHLKTLDLRKSKLVELPEDITELQELVRLFIDSRTTLPTGIGRMKALKELKQINVWKHSRDLLRELSSLTKLKTIGIHLSVEWDDEKESDLVNSLSTLGRSKLKSISVHGDSAGTLPFMSGPFSGLWLGALESIDKFSMKNSYIDIDRIAPTSCNQLTRLHKLRLGVLEIMPDRLHKLGRLPCLRELFLDIFESSGERLVFSRKSEEVFGNLKYLRISSNLGMMVRFEATSMPALEHLKLRLDAHKCRIPEDGFNVGIENLDRLRTIDVKIHHHIGTDEMVVAAEEAIRNEVQNLRRRRLGLALNIEVVPDMLC